MKVEKKEKVQPVYPKLPEGYNVLYLRNKNKVPVGCVVYTEKVTDGVHRVNIAFSSLAREDEKGTAKVSVDVSKSHTLFEVKRTGMVSPSCKYGRTVALEKLLTKPVELEISPTDSDVRTTKDGRKFLMKEVVLGCLLSKNVVSETFTSKVKNHLKWSKVRIAVKKHDKQMTSLLSKLEKKYGENTAHMLQSLL